MTRDWCSAVSGGVRISVQITPNAKKSEVTGVLDDALKIRLQAQPIEGKANEALVRFLADMLGVPKSAVSITHGHTNKRKMIEVIAPGMTVAHAQGVLLTSGG
ncbi:MAG TPA: DUF167 domain-containing protein [Noviherbaspirillum sp.]|nr:DUF167 domain-containing protein [Noviherbaspirillum sp.]